MGDDVIVKERNYPNQKYKGSVYRISNQPMNPNLSDQRNIFIDYFYIQFSKEDYEKLLMRGLDVIYQHQSVVLGDVNRDKSGKITQLYTQKPFISETEIHLDGINAMLCCVGGLLMIFKNAVRCLSYKWPKRCDYSFSQYSISYNQIQKNNVLKTGHCRHTLGKMVSDHEPHTDYQ